MFIELAGALVLANFVSWAAFAIRNKVMGKIRNNKYLRMDYNNALKSADDAWQKVYDLEDAAKYKKGRKR